MIEEVRDRYNANFRENIFEDFLADIQKETENNLDFNICETPLFINEKLSNKLIDASYLIVEELKSNEFKKHSRNAVPEALLVPNENDHPHFLQIDFGITTDNNGEFLPQVIELQGFPSLYAYQAFLNIMIKKHFYIPDEFSNYFNDLNFDSYIKLLHKLILGDCPPENVILLEIDPWKQKTRIDFYLTKKYLGIETVCLTKIKKKVKIYFTLKMASNIKLIEFITELFLMNSLTRK